MTTYDLKGRRAIETGASQGLGAAVAVELARCGAHVALTARVETGIQRFGQSQEIAALAAFLCSSQSSYIHGARIDIDGGATKGI
jgi:NAD(P)-dependent dehydrogenase (short-subunit alcohol dehydrogenase family)